MRLFRGIDTQLWAPLIDGTYAIVLTLLVIELPPLVMDWLHSFNNDGIDIRFLMARLLTNLFGYLGVFLIIFDIWAKKRRLLSVSEKYCEISGLENCMMLLSLFLSTLLPPLLSLAWRVRQDFLIEKLTGVEKNIEVVEVNSIVVFFGACTALIYVIIFIDNSWRCYQLRRIIRSQDSDDGKIQLVNALANLQALQRDTLGRILASPLFFVTFWPNIMLIAYGLSGFLHTDHEKHDLVGNIREA